MKRKISSLTFSELMSASRAFVREEPRTLWSKFPSTYTEYPLISSSAIPSGCTHPSTILFVSWRSNVSFFGGGTTERKHSFSVHFFILLFLQPHKIDVKHIWYWLRTINTRVINVKSHIRNFEHKDSKVSTFSYTIIAIIYNILAEVIDYTNILLYHLSSDDQVHFCK